MSPPEDTNYRLAFLTSQKIDVLEVSFKYQEALLISGVSVFLLGCILLTLTVLYEYFAEIKQRKRAAILKEAMIIPPRCDQKAEEIGMEAGKDWRTYFDPSVNE